MERQRYWDDSFNLQAIVERIREEAEDVKSFADMLSAEIEAYYRFINDYNPYEFNFWELVVTHPDSDFVSIGAAYMSAEDFDNEWFRDIYPISYIDDNGKYVVEYRLCDNYTPIVL